MSIKTFAAIDIGSFELTMKLYEFSGKNKMREIDCISRRLDLGSETYANARIPAEKLDELCRTLREFREIATAYKADACRAYATSAIRETRNREIVLDQIAQRTGVKLEVLSNSEQRFLDYKSIASKGELFRHIIEEKTAIVDIGGGSIQLSLFDNDTLVSTQNLRLGVLRLQEQIERMQASPSQLEALVDEMASAQLSSYKKLYLKDREISNIVIIDDYISPLFVRRQGSSGEQSVNPEDYGKLVELLRTRSRTECAWTLDVEEERIPLIFISAVLARDIAALMGAERIWAPGVTLCDGIAYEYAENIRMFQGQHDFERDILASAMNISKRYMGSRKRAETLENISITIYDSMKKVHGLGKRERLYLRLAAILQDCGKYISLVNIGETSYNIIMATEIIGLSHREREIVANIVRYNHSPFSYDRTMDSYLTVAKLTAILRLAGSLDRSHKEKLKGLRAVLKDNELQLLANTAADLTLESGFFADRSAFFQEVFSVTPVLRQTKRF